MAKLPFAQAPSMGLNAFFAYTLCQAMGFSWQHSLAIMLIEASPSSSSRSSTSAK